MTRFWVVATETVQEKIVQNQNTDVRVAQASSGGTRAIGIVLGLLLAAVLTFWAVHTVRTSDPYVHSVLQLVGNRSRGREIFQLNCATCHGLDQAGVVGPDLHSVSERKSRLALIQQVISGKTPPMPQFQPNEKDMADLLSFLETL